MSAPSAERRARPEALSPFRASAQAGHLGVDRGFVDEHQPARMAAHVRLPVIDPDPASLGYISACAFRGHQLFFYM